MAGPEPKTYRFVGCEILFREACTLAARTPHRVHLSFLPKGLHDLPTEEMVARVQQAVDEADAAGDADAILLGYARCNDGLVGVRARSVPLVLPRAHDCITLFFGSRAAYQSYFDAHPGTYFLTTGWYERDPEGSDQAALAGGMGVMASLGLHQSWEEMVAQYGEDNARYIRDSLGDWRKNYRRLCYLRMGVCDETPFVEAGRQRAAENDWAFEQREGDWSLLEKLFNGPWDEDLLVVAPGQAVTERNDARILDATDDTADTDDEETP